MSETPANHNSDEVTEWQSIADNMHTWHPDLQTHAKRIIENRGLPIVLSSDEAQSGSNVSQDKMEQLPDSITLDRENILPNSFSNGETEIVLQRHGKYIRDKHDPSAGKLTPEAVQLETESAFRYFSDLIASVPEDERYGINILFVSSDTNYANKGRRSYQTTEIAQQVAEQLFKESGIPLENILNITPDLGSQPMIMPEFREPQIFEQSPDFVEYMKLKYGDLGKDFWVAFEEDTEKDARRSMNAEGPDEIADRLKSAVTLLANWSTGFHKQEPNNRLVIWAGTHYDTISPFVKRDILHQDKKTMVLVDYGGGVVLDIDRCGQVSTSIANKNYWVGL